MTPFRSENHRWNLKRPIAEHEVGPLVVGPPVFVPGLLHGFNSTAAYEAIRQDAFKAGSVLGRKIDRKL